jgi:hypothetical protein
VLLPQQEQPLEVRSTMRHAIYFDRAIRYSRLWLLHSPMLVSCHVTLTDRSVYLLVDQPRRAFFKDRFAGKFLPHVQGVLGVPLDICQQRLLHNKQSHPAIISIGTGAAAGLGSPRSGK